MIDTTKTVGTAESFDPEKIHSLLSKGTINNVANLEKAIFCLEYLGQLQGEGLDFIFKGGSAVQILLGNSWTRLSVDVDICTNTSQEEFESVLRRVHEKFNKEAFLYRPRERVISSDVPFYLYRIETPAITDRGRIILLDAIGIRPKMPTQQTLLKAFFFDSSVEVTTPTLGALLGDKLSTIGPNTIGRSLRDSRNGLEYAKHFCDIDRLQRSDFCFEECARSYRESVGIQSKVRGRHLTMGECFNDMLFTCQVASLPQQAGEQVVDKLLHGETKERAKKEFRILRVGLQRFRPFLVYGASYIWDKLRVSAARTALLIKMINDNVTKDQAEAVLNTNIPIDKEEILELIKRVKTIPEEKRWFIVSDEIGNFPETLKIWHDFFFLSELV